jgi:uncharacterized protein (TIGR03435 family)
MGRVNKTVLRIIAGAASVALSVALSKAQPAFEVATIKPNVSGARNRMIRPSPGRLSVFNMTLKDLVRYAYQVPDFQVSGGPGWINSDQYDIEAKAEGNPNENHMKLMLRALLQDRFQLALRHETKELPVYELTVAKGGVKLQPLKPGDCIVFDRDHPPAPGQKPSDFCGNLSNGRGTFDATSASMAEIATMFSYQLGRPVVDKTGVAGQFPVHLKFSPDEVAAGTPAPDTGPSIFTAVQEQLGLKLESAKGPVEVLVIDSVEKPSEN